MRFTKLQKEFIDENVPKGSYLCFPLDIFKSEAYKKWKKDRRKKNSVQRWRYALTGINCR